MTSSAITDRDATDREEAIAIVYGVDDRFAVPLAASIQSALDNVSPGYRLDIHIIDGGLSARSRARLTSSFANRACRLIWLKPDQGKLSALRVGGTITIATYYRLLIAELLPLQPKAIYLDADILVPGNLAELWETPLGDHHLLAVQDQGVRFVSGPYGLTNYRSLGIPEGTKYFNAGVLVLNLAKWRYEKTAQRILEYIRLNYEHIRFWDQDGLNAVLWQHWGELDPRWNQMPQLLQIKSAKDSPFDTEAYNNATANPYIIHYSSPDKPWRFGCSHPATVRFFEYLDRTAYRGYRPSRSGTYLSDSVYNVTKRVRQLLRLFRF
jgi:lipopolysaccharide biosynthesis glycosyltransferase